MMEESGASSSGRATRQRHHQLSRRCGIIRFRPLNPSTDREQIQKLHEEWFPVDYTEEFFDFLCHGGGRSTSPPPPDIPASTDGDGSSGNNGCSSSNNLAQTNIKSPLYCQVATFTALSVEEYTKRKRRKGMRRANNNVQSKKMTTNTTTTTTTTMTKKLRLSALLWSYFWPFSTHDAADDEDENDEIIDEHYDDDDDDDDCILWEEESNYDENKINEQVVQQVVVGQTIKIDTDGNSDIIIKQGNDCTVVQRQIVDDNDDDDIEEGVGVGLNEHREKERMIQFYANGCKKSNDDDDESDQDIMYNTRVNGVDGATSSYSDNDERLQKECIIGCIIGTYLRSDMPASNSNINSNNTNNNKHCNSISTSNIDGGVLDTNNDNRSAFKIIPCRNGNRKNNITLPPPPPPPASRDETASLLISDPSAYSRMFYIMTLGTARTFRRYGLGSMLIESIITMIENEGTTSTSSSTTSSSSMGLEENDTYETAMQKGRALARCGRPTQLTGVLYLHVIIYNTGAIRMYERLGFIRVKEIQGKNVCLIVTTYIFISISPHHVNPPYLLTYNIRIILPPHPLSLFSTLHYLFYTSDYYTINSVNYNCYLYARYFHGNIGHYRTRSKLDGIYCYAKSFVRSFLGY